MSFTFLLTLFLIGFIGSYISGMVGIGGSIIKYPMLLYIPPLVGLAAFSAHEVSGLNAIQVLFASISGVLAFRKGNYLNKELIIYMGSSVLIGGLFGSFFSNYMPEIVINLVYAFLATIAVIMMFLPKSNDDGIEDLSKITFNKPLASSLALIVGVASGIVGAAGAFVLVPIMIVILKIPTRMTIASSLAITFISSIGTATGKIATGQVLLIPAVIMVVASIIGAPLGAKVSKKMNTKYLQWILAGLILASAIKIWFELFN